MSADDETTPDVEPTDGVEIDTATDDKEDSAAAEIDEATDSADSIKVDIKVMVPTRAGIRFQRVSKLALYQARGLTVIGGGARPWSLAQSALKLLKASPT